MFSTILSRFTLVFFVFFALAGCDDAKQDNGVQKCCKDIGMCIPTGLTGEFGSILGVDNCKETSRCLPMPLVNAADAPLSTCRSVLDAEGRCAPMCLPMVMEQADILPKGDCPDHHLCVPCYDPLTGQSTGVCQLGVDPGPSEAPRLFPRCGHDLGVCLSSALVPEDQRPFLGKEVCPQDQDLLCVPKELTAEEATLAECRSTMNAEGRCVLDCLPDIQKQKDYLTIDSCKEHHLCAPCFDPWTGESTGLCELGHDQPKLSPVIFDSCYDDLGRCVAASSIPADLRANLEPDSCDAQLGLLCIPLDFRDPESTLVVCRSLLGADGRCVPDRLPAIADMANMLPKAGCPATHRCAPCFNPLTNEDTGLCNFGDNS